MNNRPTPAEQAPTLAVGALPGPVTNPSAEARELRRLLSAVLDALTLDYATVDYDERIRDRGGWAHTVLKAVNDGTSSDIGWEADFLRSKLTAEEAEAADKAVRRSVDRAFPTVAAFLADERGEGR
ncbi:hypothetical protein OH768_44080 [Streptomyces sp. NBC_01622]|uniref:hypothetical protein n=1 Tax=Streptomyces sp. NBC_01622 TaxID=2975903 RepID=UPI00386648E0|nr:hypothetical protein OH768_44080 [Streptomyces sp. NBC_01622]